MNDDCPMKGAKCFGDMRLVVKGGGERGGGRREIHGAGHAQTSAQKGEESERIAKRSKILRRRMSGRSALAPWVFWLLCYA
jgi:hypothetical protein